MIIFCNPPPPPSLRPRLMRTARILRRFACHPPHRSGRQPITNKIVSRTAFSALDFVRVKEMSEKRVIKGVIFDMDGTLCVSAALDFTEMRRRVGCETADILGEVDSWNEERRNAAYEIIGEMEREALKTTKLMPWALEVARELDEMGVPRALVTRNARSSVEFFHKTIWEIEPFKPALSREFKPYKPAPDSLLHICKLWGCEPSEVIMVGDSAKDDVVSGNRAGAMTILLDSGRTSKWAEEFGVDEMPEDMVPHFVCADMKDVMSLLKSEHLVFEPQSRTVEA